VRDEHYEPSRRACGDSGVAVFRTFDESQGKQHEKESGGNIRGILLKVRTEPDERRASREQEQSGQESSAQEHTADDTPEKKDGCKGRYPRKEAEGKFVDAQEQACKLDKGHESGRGDLDMIEWSEDKFAERMFLDVQGQREFIEPQRDAPEILKCAEHAG
jgi:hypothetical protein